MLAYDLIAVHHVGNLAAAARLLGLLGAQANDACWTARVSAAAILAGAGAG